MGLYGDPVGQDRPTRPGIGAIQQPNERRLPRTVCTDETRHPSDGDLEVESLEQTLSAGPAHRQALYPQLTPNREG